MKLPNLEAAVVPEEKIIGYLLSATHRDGRHKAAFFLSFGFAAGAPETLRAALLNHAAEHEVSKAESTPFGTRYVVEGTIETPLGRTPKILVRCGFWRATRRTTLRHGLSARRSRQ